MIIAASSLIHSPVAKLFIFFCFYISLAQSFKCSYSAIQKTCSSRTRIQNMIDCPVGEFENLVVRAKVPVVVDFFANWCGPCKLVAPIFKQVAEDFPSDKVLFVKVDTEIHEDTVDKYNIQGLPLFGLFIDGKIVLSHSGAMNKEALRDFVNRGIQNIHTS